MEFLYSFVLPPHWSTRGARIERTDKRLTEMFAEVFAEMFAIKAIAVNGCFPMEIRANLASLGDVVFADVVKVNPIVTEITNQR